MHKLTVCVNINIAINKIYNLYESHQYHKITAWLILTTEYSSDTTLRHHHKLLLNTQD